MPALPVIAIMLEEEFARFNFAKEFKKEIEFFTLITFFPNFFLESDITQLAPFLKASLIKSSTSTGDTDNSLSEIIDFLNKNHLKLFSAN